jgi:hypothetical protein
MARNNGACPSGDFHVTLRAIGMVVFDVAADRNSLSFLHEEKNGGCFGVL